MSSPFDEYVDIDYDTPDYTESYNFFSPSQTVDNVIDALADYIGLFTTAEVIRASVNRTAMPITPFIVLTEITSIPLNKPIESYSDFVEIISEHTQIDIQIDFYGWELSEIAKVFHASFRTIWATTRLPKWLALLYCTHPMKMPIENAEEQYEQRWTLTASMQYNPDILYPQESFNTPSDNAIIPADVFYN